VTSQAQVRRLLSLVPYLREHDGAAVADVAAAFGVSPRTLRADLGVLWMCGMPGLSPGDLIDIDMDAVDGEGVIHLSNADYLTRPLRLTADEALALVLALRTLREIAGPDQRAATDRALAKLEQAAGTAPTASASVSVTSAAEEVRATLAEALQRGVRLDLVYDTATRDETTRRQVDPLRLFVLDGYGYLEAWCHRAQGLRTFRLDRIAEAGLTDLPVEPHDVELTDLSAGWFASMADAPVVTLELAREAAWVAEYYPTETTAPARDGGVVATFRVTDPAWLRHLLLRLGGSARVLSPDGAGNEAAEAAQEALAAYAALA
jgi:proteasome accessory factor C